MTMALRATRWTLLAALFLSAAAAAQDLDLSLSAEDLASLSKEARSEYNRAVAELDRANHPGALGHITRAAMLSPDVVELQFRALEVGAEHYRTADAEAAFQQAQLCARALRHVIQSPTADAHQLRRAQDALDFLMGQMERGDEIVIELAQARKALIVQFSELQSRLDRERERAEEALHAEHLEKERQSGGTRVTGRDSIGAHPLLLPSDEQPRSTRSPGDRVGANPELPHSVD